MIVNCQNKETQIEFKEKGYRTIKVENIENGMEIMNMLLIGIMMVRR